MRFFARVTALSLSVVLGLSLAPVVGSATAAEVASDAPAVLNFGDDTAPLPASQNGAPTGAAARLAGAAIPTQIIDFAIVTVTGATTDAVVVPTEVQAPAFVTKLNTYWHAESGGDVTLSMGRYSEITISATACAGDGDIASVLAKASVAAYASEFAVGWQANHHLLALTTQKCGLGYGTVGGTTQGGTIAVGQGISDAMGLPATLHEFGHNLGFHHANAALCATASGDASDADLGLPGEAATSCDTEEYGDYLDIMGYTVASSLPHLSVPQKLKMGYISGIVPITSATPSSVVTLMPLGGTGTRAIQINDAHGEKYFVEYRTPDSADVNSFEFWENPECVFTFSDLTRCDSTSSPATGAVRILRRVAVESDYDGTDVLAVGPIAGDPSTDRDTHLDAGESFTNYDGEFTVTVNALNKASGATIAVTFAGTTPATATATSLVVTPTVTNYGSTSVTATATVAPANAVGTVTFFDGATAVGSVAVTGGTAAVTLPPTSALGTHTLTAQFVPTDPAAFIASTTPAGKTFVVNKGSSTVTLALTEDANGGLIATANVGQVGATASGTVVFDDDDTPLGSVAVGGGIAKLSVPSMTFGEHFVTATFTPTNASYATVSASRSTDLGDEADEVEEIVKTPTSVTFKFTATKVKKTKKAIISVTVKGGKPTGKITVFDAKKKIATFTLKASAKGKAKITLPKIKKVGKHTITVKYSGSDNFKPSASKGLKLTIV